MKSKRKYFGSLHEIIDPPNLLEIQLNSYSEILQKDIAPNKRKRIGFQAVFEEIFPIKSYDNMIELDFSFYEIEDPKTTSLEATQKGLTYSASLYVNLNSRILQELKKREFTWVSCRS